MTGMFLPCDWSEEEQSMSSKALLMATHLQTIKLFVFRSSVWPEIMAAVLNREVEVLRNSQVSEFCKKTHCCLLLSTLQSFRLSGSRGERGSYSCSTLNEIHWHNFPYRWAMAFSHHIYCSTNVCLFWLRWKLDRCWEESLTRPKSSWKIPNCLPSLQECKSRPERCLWRTRKVLIFASQTALSSWIPWIRLEGINRESIITKSINTTET